MGDPEFKRRLARAIAANQAQAFTRFQRKRSVAEQGHVAIGQVGIGERRMAIGKIVAAALIGLTPRRLCLGRSSLGSGECTTASCHLAGGQPRPCA
jgi:hypothetical protein